MGNLYTRLTSYLDKLKKLRKDVNCYFPPRANINPLEITGENNSNYVYNTFVSGDQGLQALAQAILDDLVELSIRTDLFFVLDDSMQHQFKLIFEFNSDSSDPYRMTMSLGYLIILVSRITTDLSAI